MEIQFFGAAQTVTGSMHMISANGRKVLLDCGLYQGKREEAFERNKNLPFDPGSVDACVLSHAHMDHSGNLPTLVKRGFRGQIFTTPATADLSEIMLEDSARLQVADVEYVNKKRKGQGLPPVEPLYTPDDVPAVLDRFTRLPYETPREIVPGFRVTLRDAGHILGSATTQIAIDDSGAPKNLVFTGDLGRSKMPILRDPVTVSGADTLITESTYGDRVHEPEGPVKARLAQLVNEVSAKRSKLIIPAFSVGRTQQLLYYLDELYHAKQAPGVAVYVDSPLSTHATDIYESHPECYDAETLAKLKSGDSPFAFPRLRFTASPDESKGLNFAAGPMIVISASGMCEGGRILHHLKHGLGDAANVVLFVGFQAENTLGRYLSEGQKQVRIFGEEVRVVARVEKIEALSGHADRNELLAWDASLLSGLQRAFVVHGEPSGSQALADELAKRGVPRVVCPARGDAVSI